MAAAEGGGLHDRRRGSFPPQIPIWLHANRPRARPVRPDGPAGHTRLRAPRAVFREQPSAGRQARRPPRERLDHEDPHGAHLPRRTDHRHPRRSRQGGPRSVHARRRSRGLRDPSALRTDAEAPPAVPPDRDHAGRRRRGDRSHGGARQPLGDHLGVEAPGGGACFVLLGTGLRDVVLRDDLLPAGRRGRGASGASGGAAGRSRGVSRPERGAGSPPCRGDDGPRELAESPTGSGPGDAPGGGRIRAALPAAEPLVSRRRGRRRLGLHPGEARNHAREPPPGGFRPGAGAEGEPGEGRLAAGPPLHVPVRGRRPPAGHPRRGRPAAQARRNRRHPVLGPRGVGGRGGGLFPPLPTRPVARGARGPAARTSPAEERARGRPAPRRVSARRIAASSTSSSSRGSSAARR